MAVVSCPVVLLTRVSRAVRSPPPCALGASRRIDFALSFVLSVDSFTEQRMGSARSTAGAGGRWVREEELLAEEGVGEEGVEHKHIDLYISATPPDSDFDPTLFDRLLPASTSPSTSPLVFLAGSHSSRVFCFRCVPPPSLDPTVFRRLRRLIPFWERCDRTAQEREQPQQAGGGGGGWAGGAVREGEQGRREEQVEFPVCISVLAAGLQWEGQECLLVDFDFELEVMLKPILSCFTTRFPCARWGCSLYYSVLTHTTPHPCCTSHHLRVRTVSTSAVHSRCFFTLTLSFPPPLFLSALSVHLHPSAIASPSALRPARPMAESLRCVAVPEDQAQYPPATLPPGLAYSVPVPAPSRVHCCQHGAPSALPSFSSQ
ncbi:hypothetical protein MSAN_00287600 [Mycena sanguinolenta]|uniref:Uncharacterized protein n=1 Tax=Mycena sanguinolenta TaxID=230812 RepID=A0A8H7DI53_9AGAR|nr:hypothetical protein MSAN_00287600 [Mycena sanguinolenta]